MATFYHQFLREVRDTFGVDQQEAIYAYQEFKEALGRGPTVRDFRRHGEAVLDLLEQAGALRPSPPIPAPVARPPRQPSARPRLAVPFVPIEREITISKTRRGPERFAPRTRKAQRLFQLKVRVRTTVPMSDDQVFAAVKRAARTRIVPPGLEIDFLDWQSGRAERMRSGSYAEPGKTLDALHDFNAMIQAGLPRIERVSEP